jgi:hypothetical protein
MLVFLMNTIISVLDMHEKVYDRDRVVTSEVVVTGIRRVVWAVYVPWLGNYIYIHNFTCKH